MMYDEEHGVRWDPTLTAEERCRTISGYADMYGFPNFVETGTAGGDTCLALADKFMNVYTIEIAEYLYNISQQRLAVVHNVECILGDSSVVLPSLLQRINGSCIFWLDAHYCGDPRGRGQEDTPIATELQYIFATQIPHVILIDDARLFGRDPAYPTIDWVRNIATWQDIEYDFAYVDDMMRIVPVRREDA